MNPAESTEFPTPEPAAAGEIVGPTYELGQIVDFSSYDLGADPAKLAGNIIGPDLQRPGQMIVQAGVSDLDKIRGAVTGMRYSVWHAGAAGLVCGQGAPTRNVTADELTETGALKPAGEPASKPVEELTGLMERQSSGAPPPADEITAHLERTAAENAAEDAQAAAAAAPQYGELTPKNVPMRTPFAILHRGPHTEAVTEILKSLFGHDTGAAIAAAPVPQSDGTVLYGIVVADNELPAVARLIEEHHDAQHVLAAVEPTAEQLDQLADANLERRWPVVVTP